MRNGHDGGVEGALTDGGVPAQVPGGGARESETGPLESQRRRETLRVLSARRLVAGLEDDAMLVTMDLDDLVDAVAERERTGPGSGVEDRDEHRRAVAATLRCDHLPVLDDEGVVEYDEDAETVTYHGDPEVEMLLPLEE